MPKRKDYQEQDQVNGSKLPLPPTRRVRHAPKEGQKTVLTLPASDRVQVCQLFVLEELKKEINSKCWDEDLFATIELRVSMMDGLTFTLTITPRQ